MAEPPAAPARRSLGRSLAFGATSVLLGALLVEASLQLLALAVPGMDRVLRNEPLPATIEDPVLGHRPNPRVAGHDPAGFRNTTLPARVDVACIGDSQTYGTSVGSEEAWPRQLAALTGLSTYNMAFGGYGPAHHLVLAREARALAPRLVLIAFYSGNDLVEAFEMVHRRGQLAFLAAGGGPRAPRAPGDWEQALDATSVITRKPSEPPTFRERLRLRQLVKASKRALEDPEDRRSHQEEREHAERRWRKQRAVADDAGRPHLLWAYEGTGGRTILTPAVRLAVLRLDDPTLAEGLRISLEALRLMEQEARGLYDLAVVLIPTKESVFYESVREQGGDVPPVLHELAGHERALWSALQHGLDELGIPWIDTLPALRETLRQGENPYHESTDGHPSARGHHAIARAVADSPVLRRFGP